MVVKSQIKFIKSLQQKKYRTQHGMFVAEGIKTVQELLKSQFKAHSVYSTDINILGRQKDNVQLISELELKKLSGFRTPNTVLAVFHIAEPREVDFSNWVVALDAVQDPGNLGTIIRLCDWFGIQHLLCSYDSVDCYNPKVLQATMGSIARVNVIYTNIEEVLDQGKHQVYGAFMEGTTVSEQHLPKAGILIMGNEGNGISKKIEAFVDTKISIPQFGGKTAESLNVATATAVLLNEIRRE